MPVHVDSELAEAQQQFGGAHLQGVEGVQRLLSQKGERRVGRVHQADGGRLPLQGQQSEARRITHAQPVPDHAQPLHPAGGLHLPQLLVVGFHPGDLVAQNLGDQNYCVRAG